VRKKILKIRGVIQVALVIALGIAFASSASAQDKKADAQLRTIHGSVLDKSETPAPSSVVYLLNVKNQAVKTYIADEAGNYRFSGLDPNSDYEVHAEHADAVSPTRTLSSYDTRRDVEIILKLTRKKADH
jgi:Carboxypeptidase regulatory-like domain